MKLWKKILLQAGIFTSVFALGGGIGFLTCYKKVAPNKQAQAEPEVEYHEETPAEKFMSNLSSSKALEGNLSLSVYGDKEETNNNTLKAFELKDDIHIDITDLQVSIADLDNIKVQGDVNLKVSDFDLDFTVGYFDDTIYLDYLDTHFYLETKDITKVLDMLPTFGIDFSLPDLSFVSFDIDAILESLLEMPETKTETEHYFTYRFMKGVVLKFYTNDNYEMLGVDLLPGNVFGINLEATSDIHNLKEDIETLVNPSTIEGGPTYSEFDPAFTLIEDVMHIVNEKKAHVAYSVDVDKVEDNTDFFNLNGDLDFDINEMKLFTTVNVQENNRSYDLTAGYMNQNLYASLKDLKVSLENQSIITLTKYISEKVEGFDLDLESVFSDLGSVTEKIDLHIIAQYVNDLPEFISNFALTSNEVSLTFNPRYFGLDASSFDIAIRFDEESIKSVNLSNLVISGYLVNATLDLSEYQPVEIDVDSYVALDPALPLIDSVDELIHQDKFGITFNIAIDDNDEQTKDVTLDGSFQFALKKADVEVINEDGTISVVNKTLFDYGAGVLNISDKDSYPHRIVADAKSSGQVLLSYSGTSKNKTNAKFDNATIDSIIDLASKLLDEQDDHFIELFGSLLEQTASTPLNDILKGKYGALLDSNIITSLDVVAGKVTLGLNGAIIGMDELDFVVAVRFNDDAIEGLDISGLQLGDKTINLSANLSVFDENAYNSYSLKDNGNFIDLSTISMFLDMGIKTSEFNYYEFSGNITVAVGDLFDAISLPANVKIQNDKGHVRMLAHIEAPMKVLLALFTDDYALNVQRNSYLMFDNQGDGMFHLLRHDYRESGFLQSAIDKKLQRRYTTDYFMDHILEILLGGMVGLNKSTCDKVGNIESGEGQIQYENIVQDYHYTSSEKNYYFAINIGEVLKSDSLETLSLTVYHNNNGIFNRAVVDMSINVLITLHLHLDMNLTGSVTINDNQMSFMTDYVSQNGNVTLNQPIF